MDEMEDLFFFFFQYNIFLWHQAETKLNKKHYAKWQTDANMQFKILLQEKIVERSFFEWNFNWVFGVYFMNSMLF